MDADAAKHWSLYWLFLPDENRRVTVPFVGDSAKAFSCMSRMCQKRAPDSVLHRPGKLSVKDARKMQPSLSISNETLRKWLLLVMDGVLRCLLPGLSSPPGHNLPSAAEKSDSKAFDVPEGIRGAFPLIGGMDSMIIFGEYVRLSRANAE
ncbi:hypothetical protein T265_11568 [Opisthorchis viverrini]|uniref:Uncharacterized protein n=1 Tax=Opisthorchis viverrini TaxID=6198 RepID=A0A074YY77_OPIVI|nr:hypothetical protein T265_11568 [Opisthorchis viverrini]KER19736.1 hypothetical protein T265_11568 [Opisthorchis viverrini]